MKIRSTKDTLLNYRFSADVDPEYTKLGYLPYQYFESSDLIEPNIPYTLRMREIRKAKKLTQTDVAEILFTSQKQYSRWETGASIIPIAELSVFSLYFNISLDYILGFSFDDAPIFTPEERRRRIKAMNISPYYNRNIWWFKDEDGNVEEEYKGIVADIEKRKGIKKN